MDQVNVFVEDMSKNPTLFINKFLKKKPSQKQLEFIKATENYKHVIAIWSRQSGKTTILSQLTTNWLYFGEGEYNEVGEHIPETIYIFAPILDQVIHIYYKIKQIIESDPILLSYIEQLNTDQIILKDGKRCVFRSASPGSHIRGPTATKILVDESQDVTDEKYYGDILPMGATTNALVLETGTPHSKNHFHETILAASRAHSDIKLIKQLWYECPFIDRGYVLRRKESNLTLWKQEYMCEFIEEGSTCFPSKWFEHQESGRTIVWDYNYYTSISEVEAKEAEIRELLEKNKEMCFNMGIDLGKEVDSTVITIMRVDKFPYTLIYQEEIQLGKSYVHVAGVAKRVNDIFQCNEINVDYTSEKSFVDMLVENGVPVSYSKKHITGTIVFTTKTKTQMVNKVQALIQKSIETDTYLIAFPKSADKLILQFTQQQFMITGNGIYKYYHPTNAHDDSLWSTLLALKNVSILSEDITEFKDYNSAYAWEEHDEKIGPRRFEEPELAIARQGGRDKSRWSQKLGRK